MAFSSSAPFDLAPKCHCREISRVSSTQWSSSVEGYYLPKYQRWQHLKVHPGRKHEILVFCIRDCRKRSKQTSASTNDRMSDKFQSCRTSMLLELPKYHRVPTILAWESSCLGVSLKGNSHNILFIYMIDAICNWVEPFLGRNEGMET